MNLRRARFVLEGIDVCIASRATDSSFKVVADALEFIGEQGDLFRRGLIEGERFPVTVYLGNEDEKVVGEAFMYPETPDRLHVGIWKSYGLNAITGRWEG